MKTWKRALALVLALVMALSLVALPSFAAGEEESAGDTGMPYIKDQGGKVEKDGLVMSKTIKEGENGQFLLTLEAYATGSTTTTTSTKPMDIVLVLDVSGSMDENLTEAGYRYNEVYDLSTNGTYYYKNSSNGRYQRAYYCDGEDWRGNSNHDAGWYTRNHQSLRGDCQGKVGTRLIPKTSSADTTGTQFYVQEYVAAVTKMETLKSAVKGFVNSVSAKSPDSNIAIVKFGAEINNEIGNDFNGSGWNYTQIVKELTPASNAEALNTAVDGLQAAGYTPSYLGLQLANEIIQKDPNKDRQKVVVLFTDGEPNNYDHRTEGFTPAAANQAIANSKSIKDAKATVYTIGCFGTTPSDTSDTGKYMNYVSSNYPNATSMTSGGTKADPANYYKTVSSASELESIFKDISQTIGGTTVKLTSTSVLRDVISNSFKLPEGADKNSITAYSVDCMAVNDDGTYTWSANHDGIKYSVTVEGKTINVTDFDYAANWVGKDTTTGKMHTPAKKLVVEIPIVPEQDATGSVKTNGDASGIYADSTVKDPVEKFPSPVVYIPYFTVVHVASTVNDQGHNEGKRTGETHHPVWCNRPFNLTSVVTRNYLYGGTFNEDTCINVHNDVQEQGNPMKLNPTENATYYIWEVPDTYLRPFGYWISRHLEGGQGTLSVTQLYLLAAVDRVNYADAGLKVSFGNGTSQYISSSCEELSNPNTEQLGSATVYQMLETVKGHAGGEVIDTWYLKNGIPVNYEGPLTKSEETGKYLDANDKNNSPIDDGCIIGHRLKGKEFESFQKSGVTYRPYWVTLDGVRVEGVRSRNYTFVVGSADPGKPSKDDQLPAVYQYLEKQQSAQTLTLRTNLLAGDTEPAVNDLTVTVIDGSNAPQTIKVAPNGSVRDQVAYQAPAGKVFAGWFTDDSFTTPADLDQVTQDTTIYAKYVSDSYLDLDYSRTGLFRLRGVTLISAVDNPANYQVSGFIVGDQKVDVSYASRYRIFKTPANLFGAARDAKLMLADKSLSGAGDLEVTPYWVTLDGTEVHGVTHTLHYNTRTIWE